MSIPLGQFELTDVVAEGAMGQIWRARHRDNEVEVAVKVITGEKATDPRYQESFRREVQAVASLNHPRIITVFDYGLISEAASEVSSGLLGAGSPWLAMELSPIGSAAAFLPPPDWQTTFLLLLQVLDALAHAHARDIVHRDLKPGNLLLLPDKDGEVVLKLSDFGIAHAAGPTSEGAEAAATSATAGTPPYMAPEQFRGSWRDFGPWTDLYALGCLAFELVCGHPPFVEEDLRRLTMQHLLRSPPPLTPRFAVPRGFESWVHRLLDKSQLRRFRRAADAAWALLRLVPEGAELRLAAGWLEGRGGEAAPARQKAAPTSGIWVRPRIRQNHTLPVPGAPLEVKSLHTLSSSRSAGSFETLPIADFELPTDPAELPPMPDHWSTGLEQGAPVHLTNVGLGLFDLREVPFVGRETSRDVIWKTLGEVYTTGRSRAVVVRGEAGCGKSRLVEWMSRRAHEVGAATLLRATHHPIGGAGEGLARMVERFLRCEGLGRRETWEHIKELLHRHEVEDAPELAASLTEILHPAESPDAVPHVRFSSRGEYFGVIDRLLSIMVATRPIIVWLDDVQWGIDAIEFARRSLTDGVPRILFLLTVNDNRLAERRREERLLSALLQRDDVIEHPLEPLPGDDLGTLLRCSLHLAEPLIEQIRQRSAGNPLLALQLLGDWVQRSILTATPEGFTLATPDLPPIPDSIYDLWQQRLRRLVEGTSEPEGALRCLELAASLGQFVRSQEWRWSCHMASYPLDPEIVEPLVSHGLVQRQVTGWEFTHGLLRETLERSAVEYGRSQALHRVCARMIESHYSVTRTSAQERRVRHLLSARDYDEALDLLLNLARQHVNQDDYAQARHLLERYEHVVGDLNLPADDERRSSATPILAQVYIGQGRPKVASTIAGEAIERAKVHGWEMLQARGRLVRGIARLNRALFDLAERDFRICLNLARRHHQDLIVATALRGLANIDMLRGNTSLAEQALKKAYRYLESSGDELAMATCVSQLALLLKAQGKLEAARDDLMQSLAVLRHVGARRLEAEVLIALGDIARQKGELDGAELHYLQAMSLSRTYGANTLHVARLNLGLLETERGNFKEALRLIQPLEEVFVKNRQILWLIWLHFSILPALAGTHRYKAVEAHLKQIGRVPDSSRPFNADLAYMTDLAGTMLEEDGRTDLAVLAYRLAHQQWEVLGNEGQLMAARARLQHLDPDYSLL